MKNTRIEFIFIVAIVLMGTISCSPLTKIAKVSIQLNEYDTPVFDLNESFRNGARIDYFEIHKKLVDEAKENLQWGFKRPESGKGPKVVKFVYGETPKGYIEYAQAKILKIKTCYQLAAIFNNGSELLYADFYLDNTENRLKIILLPISEYCIINNAK